MLMTALVLIMLVSVSPVLAQDGSAPTPGGTEAVLIALSIAIAGFMEYAKEIFIKPLSTRFNWDDERYRQIVSGVAAVAGISAAFLVGRPADVLAMIGIDTLPPAVGIALAGVIVSLGNQFVHEFLDFTKKAVGIVRGLELVQQERASAISLTKPQG